MTTKIILNRKPEFINKRRAFQFFIDGKEVSKIKNGGSEEFILEPGTHELQAKINWCSTEVLTVDLKEGETLFLKMRSGMKYFTAAYFLMIAALLSTLIFRYAHIPLPENFYWYQAAGIAPFIIYLLVYVTIKRKEYIVIETDKDTIFN